MCQNSEFCLFAKCNKSMDYCQLVQFTLIFYVNGNSLIACHTVKLQNVHFWSVNLLGYSAKNSQKCLLNVAYFLSNFDFPK